MKFSVERDDHFSIVASNSGSQLSVRDGPLFLYSMQLFQFCIETFELVFEQLSTLVAQL